mmetsp:Transcript_14040/g.19494  ORF Transcript_14040/g.19494 Transcript_14040/m.19494 type:complete len:390 (-) Transcript_14040:726-1895(-)
MGNLCAGAHRDVSSVPPDLSDLSVSDHYPGLQTKGAEEEAKDEPDDNDGEDIFAAEEWENRCRLISGGDRSLREVFKMSNDDKIGQGKFVELWSAVPYDSKRESDIVEEERICLYIVQSDSITAFSKHAQRVNKKYERLPPHQNLVQSRIWEGPDSSNRLWRITEYFSGGSIRDMRDCGLLEEPHIAHALYCAFKALAHMSDYGVVHGNVTASNLLLSNAFEVKLGDVSVDDRYVRVSKYTPIDGELLINEMVRNPEYLAPETFNGIKINEKLDVWATGITALELAYGRPPHHNKPFEHIAKRRTKGEPPFLQKLYKESKGETDVEMKRDSTGSSSEWSEQFCDFIRCCLIKNFKMRPKARNLLQHEFLKTKNWSQRLHFVHASASPIR